MKHLIVIALLVCFAQNSRADGGMYPLSEIYRLDLKSAGLAIETTELYNPDGVSLLDAIVNVGRCSGSFVSAEGLILTNHHCAYDAVQNISTTENDYLTHGFLARTREEEALAEGFTVRINESYRDVSKEVLSVVSPEMDPVERSRAITRRTKEIVSEVEKDNPGKQATVAEMFAGRTYVLFVYTFLKDVRLVYAPPRSIGEFGGENDNWVWPRHTGDFTFMRAYVSPDGSPASYSPDNIPYTPRRYLRVQPEGVDEEDFVFILGYPGRTFRHQPAAFLAYEAEVRMPFVVELNAWQIALMEEMGSKDRSIALKHSSRIKSLANVLKNHRGKLQGIGRLELVRQWREEEQRLQQYINADKKRRTEFGDVLGGFEDLYGEIRRTADRDLILDYLLRASLLVDFGFAVYEAAHEREKPDLDRIARFMDRSFPATQNSYRLRLNEYHAPTDRLMLKDMLLRAARLPEGYRIPAVEKILDRSSIEQSIERFLDDLYGRSQLGSEQILMSTFLKSPAEIRSSDDPAIRFAADLHPSYIQLRTERQKRDGIASTLHARLVTVKEQFAGEAFIPDANSTLRLTFGRVRGYSPADATYYSPITTVKGIAQKTTGNEPFDTPQRLLELHRTKNFGRYKHPRLGDVPVAILYNMDTTGGNSGSAVMNSRGELVGVNFDRAFEATINDYGWSEEYSRSIGVDIRFVLWVTEKFGGALHLLQEMGVPSLNR